MRRKGNTIAVQSKAVKKAAKTAKKSKNPFLPFVKSTLNEQISVKERLMEWDSEIAPDVPREPKTKLVREKRREDSTYILGKLAEIGYRPLRLLEFEELSLEETQLRARYYHANRLRILFMKSLLPDTILPLSHDLIVAADEFDYDFTFQSV